jgi:hypothetical protein
MDVRKWLRNVTFATHAILGGVRRQKRGRAVRELGPEARSSNTRGRKRPKHKQEGFQGKGKEEVVEKRYPSGPH